MFLWRNKKDISIFWMKKAPYLLLWLLIVLIVFVPVDFLLQLYYYEAFYTPPYNSGGVLWYHVGCLCVRSSFCPSVLPSVCCPSVVHLSVFCFRMITRVNFNGFSPNLMCALILWTFGLELLMGKFRQFLTVICQRQYFHLRMII